MLTILDISMLDNIFTQLRRHAISGSQNYVKIAFAIACILVLIYLCKLAYNIISDEQHGGFGGVELKDILRPIILLALLQGAPLVVGALDGITNWVVVSTANSIVIEDADRAFERQMDILNSEYDSAVDAEREEAKQLNKDYGVMTGFVEWLNEQIADLCAWVKKLFFGTTTKAGSQFIPWLCTKLYTFLCAAYIVVYNIFLCLLALSFPFTVCLSILGIWRNNLTNFITQYIQVSFWRVVMALVQWCIASARVWAASVSVSAVSGAGMASKDILAQVEASAWLTAIICIAGCMCIVKVPNWAATIIGGQEATGGAGSVAGSINAAPGRGVMAGAKTSKFMKGFKSQG